MDLSLYKYISFCLTSRKYHEIIFVSFETPCLSGYIILTMHSDRIMWLAVIIGNTQLSITSLSDEAGGMIRHHNDPSWDRFKPIFMLEVRVLVTGIIHTYTDCNTKKNLFTSESNSH